SMLSANAALWDGRYADATLLAEVAAADPTAVGAFVPGENPIVWGHGAEGWRLWLGGRAGAGLRSVRAGVAAARGRANPSNLAMALFLVAQVLLWRGELVELSAVLEEGCAVADEHGYRLWGALLRGCAGGAHLARGDAAAAAVDLRQATEELRR